MRILIHDRSGAPFSVELAKELGSRGHTVLYSYGAFFQSPKGNLEDEPEGFRIEPIYLDKPFQKYSYIKRYFQEIAYAKKLADQVGEFDPDVLLIGGSHPDAIKYVYKHIDSNIQRVFWVQDIYGIAIKRILKKKYGLIGNMIGNHYSGMEKNLLNRSSDIVLITEDFIDLMDEWRIDPGKLHVIYNWTPIDEIPVKGKSNPWSTKHNLEDGFCFLYSGTLGLKHNPALLLNLAIHYQKDPNVRIVVITEGIGADWLREESFKRNLDNIIIMDFQPYKQLPEVLGAGDVLIGILESDAGVYSAPSKVLTYLCAKRPLLLAMPRENLSARLVSENKAGEVADPTDITGFLNAADKLYRNDSIRKEYAHNARMLAEERFNITEITDKFESIFDE